MLVLVVLDEYMYHLRKYCSIEEQDGENGSQEGTEKNTRLTNEAAGEKEVKYVNC